ncbi:MAG TPA: penicillin acylase family protein [Solirubrobacteraceae bacterium]|nr:penicillin acylase family protein [Solirubrobacteraceae bacterium]
MRIRLDSPRWLITAAAVIGCLAMAGPASASILRATSILPPGESGFVAASGLLSGTGSPHLYDQQNPFIHFERKDAMLNQKGTATYPAPGVKIVREAYGVPSVTGKNAHDLWWGAGWATAQDRLFQLELFRHQTEGTMAAVLGPSYLPSDIAVRRDFYTTAQRRRMFNELPRSMRARYTAYAAGINAWVDHVNQTPADMPGEFLVAHLKPTHFSVTDLVAIGVYLARTTPNGDGSDLQNMEAIKRSGPVKFNRILPLRIPGQVATVPRSAGLFPSVPGRTPRQERAALLRSYRFVRSLPVPGPNNLGTEQVSGTMPKLAHSAFATAASDGAAISRQNPRIRRGGSYMVAVSDPRTHHAVFFNGPELGFSAPEELYEMELHGPGLDVRGVTAPGVPVIVIGHNKHIAFGATSGLSQTNALYAERVVHGKPNEYLYRGRARKMTCRNSTFDYAASKSAPAGAVTLRLCRTVNGPVQERAGNIAYARRYATWMQEMKTITGIAALDTAKNIRQVGKAAARVTWNENIMAADDHGNIGYWHPGLLPVRPKNWDERLPYPGDGRAEWRGFLPVAQRPHVVDPRQHWLANWNTLPSQGWTTGNDPASERVAGPWFRGAYLDRLAASLAKHPSFAGMNALIHHAGTTAQQRPLATTELQRALHRAKGGAATVLRTILAWNGSYANENAKGTVSPGVAAWQTFKNRLQALAIRPLGAAGQLIGGGQPNDEHVFDVSLGQAYALRTEGPAGWRRAAQATDAALTKRFHSANPSTWREPRAMFPESALGAEQPPPMPFFDRGTFEQVVELGR